MDEPIPYGYCHCGCGNKAPVAERSDRRKGWVKGEPKKWIARHFNRIDPHRQEKRCPGCEQTLPIDAFGKDRGNRDGRQTKCKPCAVKATMASYERHRVEVLQRTKERRKKNREERLRKQRERRKPDPRRRSELTPEQRLKVDARQRVSDEIKAGRMVRGCCEVCGEPDAQAHHDDYTKPLQVRWLCHPHHAEHHAIYTGGASSPKEP